jgi:molecular chaperone DnaK
MLVHEAREAVKAEDTPLDRMRSMTAELQQLVHGLGRTAGHNGAAEAGHGSDDEDVIDAEFTAG